ncbi:hypothetical protein ALC53_01255, partial [Atta colombica]
RCYTISRMEERQGNGDNQLPDTGYAIKVSAVELYLLPVLYIVPAISFNHGLQLEAIHTCGISDGGGSGKNESTRRKSSGHQDQVFTTDYCAYRATWIGKRSAFAKDAVLGDFRVSSRVYIRRVYSPRS